MCDCPTKASLERIDRLADRLEWLMLLGFFFPTAANCKLDVLFDKTTNAQIDAHMRRYFCPVHNPKTLKTLMGEFREARRPGARDARPA